MYENRRYTIFPVSELHKIDFTQVEETSAETVRKSFDETKTFVKWEQQPFDPTPYEIIQGDTNEVKTIYPQPPGLPSCIQNVIEAEGPYTHSEMLEILNTPEWTTKFKLEE